MQETKRVELGKKKAMHSMGEGRKKEHDSFKTIASSWAARENYRSEGYSVPSKINKDKFLSYINLAFHGK